MRLWAETESGGDIETLLDKCSEQILFATKISGTTLYFTASTGDKPQDFLQLEVEVLQEVLDRPLSDPDFLPDSVEEFLDPVDYPRLEPRTGGQAALPFPPFAGDGGGICRPEFPQPPCAEPAALYAGLAEQQCWA